mmetsp:Transcript_36881/g.101777  ORF Transcript_36881/g.101777 Transcript_36881/m.101777 type:complete len:143 (+) Transcript_36881:78-506(+)
MGITGAHDLFKIAWTAVPLSPSGQLHNCDLMIDVAAFKLKGFYGDVASYYRDGVDGMSCGYRRYLAKVLSALAASAGSTDRLTASLMALGFHRKRESTRGAGLHVTRYSQPLGKRTKKNGLQTLQTCTRSSHTRRLRVSMGG